jgi:nucleoside-diphosphate-sugar epimerase/SAM-dependent methyltransferase
MNLIFAIWVTIILDLFNDVRHYGMANVNKLSFKFPENFNKKIGIIGAGGYIGSSLLEFFENHEIKIIGFDKNPNIPSMPQIQKMKSSDIPSNILRSFDIIIYLGGLTGRIASLVSPSILEQENIYDPVNLARRMHKNQTLIYASTSAVTEGSGVYPYSENTQIKQELLDPYSLSLYRRENAMRNLSETCKECPQLIGTRFGTVIGHSKGQRIDMIHMALVRSAYTTGVLNVQNSETSRAILALKDLVRALSTIVINIERIKKRSELFHLTSFNTLIISIATEVAMQTGSILNIQKKKDTDPIGFSISNVKFENTFLFKFVENQSSCVRDIIENVPHSIMSKGAHQIPNIPVMNNGYGNETHTMPCPVCGSHHIQETLDLKKQPLANNFLETIDAALASTHFPLKLVRCKTCNHLFLSTIVERSSLFTKYLYESGTSKTLLKYFEWLAHKITNQLHPTMTSNKKPSVLDIACNDGSQLDKFKEIGWDTYGVDPAANIVPKAVEKGHKVKVGFWGEEKYTHLPPPDKLDVIIAQNVFAHVPNPVNFLKSCKDVMGDNTVLYIQTSQCNMHQTGQFDTAYHEHISFFTGHSYMKAAELSGLHITNFEITPIHGDSCFVTFRKQKTKNPTNGIQKRLDDEVDAGITNDFFYIKYAERAKFTRNWIHEKLEYFSKKGYVIGAYGAAAKGMVLLHFLLDLPEKTWKISFVVDDAPMKQNTYCPGTNIPVLSTKLLGSLNMKQPLVIVVLAWNFWTEIADNIRRELKGKISHITIILPFPTSQLVKLDIDSETNFVSVLSNIQYYPKLLTYTDNVSIPSIKRRIILIGHIYHHNHKHIFPIWITHHSNMFDNAILIDYTNSNSYISIFKNFAPSSWKIFHYKNMKSFNMELSFYTNDWKIDLIPTEFIISPNLRILLQNKNGNVYSIRSVIMDKSLLLTYDYNIPIEPSSILSNQTVYGNYLRHFYTNRKQNYKKGTHVADSGIVINFNYLHTA